MADPAFTIRRLYLKDMSFEAPEGAMTFTRAWDPDLDVDLNVAAEALAPTTHEVALRITVTATNGGTTAFLIEAVQAGIFEVSGYDQPTLDRVLQTVCPNILFPYAREAIDSIVGKASFPPLMLAPVNFESMYDELRGANSPAG